MMIQIVEPSRNATLKVIGCGGGGGNAINHMVMEQMAGVDFIVVNSDHQALDNAMAPYRIQIGKALTKGLGCGGVSDRGRRAAEEDEDEIREALAGADMVFITAGMGGGTGTGSAPVVARIARELGALTVAVVTKPFTFEGRRRMKQAEEGLAILRERVDTLITIPNDRLLSVVERGTPLTEAFKLADQVLLQATKGISDLIIVPGLVNLDFADVREVMSERGNALMGTGIASGPNRALEAARLAVASPLLEDVSIAGAEALLVNICGGPGLTLHEVQEANDIILDEAGMDANVIFGAVIDPSMGDEMRITVIATGFGKESGRPGLHIQDPLEFGVSRNLGGGAAARVDLRTAAPAMPRPEAPRHESPRHEAPRPAAPEPAMADESLTWPVRRSELPSQSWAGAPVDAVPLPHDQDEEEETRRIEEAKAQALRRVRENMVARPMPAEMAARLEPEPESVAAGQAEPVEPQSAQPTAPEFVEARLNFIEPSTPAGRLPGRILEDRWTRSYTRDNLDVPAFLRRPVE